MKERICQLVEEKRDFFTDLSDRIWAHPELSFHEEYASDLLTGILEANGFRVERGLAGMPTAFKASWGSGKPVIGFLGEFDALAGLSQEAGCAEKRPVMEGGNGHGCGHNTIAVSCTAAALTMKQLMEETKTAGTVVVFGCPGEEKGCGKSFMARDGVFDGVDAALAPHPSDENNVMDFNSLAAVQVEFSFTGVASHAAATPHLGRSALDAADLMIVGVQFLREHIIQEARIHHAYLDAGGTSPNVVQPTANLLFYIRAPKAEQVKEIYERVQAVARGAAEMTGTTVEVRLKSGMYEYVMNDVLGHAVEKSWAEIGETPVSEEALAVAARMAPTLGKTWAPDLVDVRVPKYTPSPFILPGSTDVGDVSYLVPVAGVNFAGIIKGTPAHSWQFVSQAGSALMHDAMIQAIKVMAHTGMTLLQNPSLVEAAKAELQKKTGGSYESLISPEVKTDV